MRTNKIQPRRALLFGLLALLILYSLYQARVLLFGPQIWIDSHKDGEVLENSLVEIKGGAENIAWISFNDRQIFTDEEGRWEEKLIVSEGSSIITLKARDRFGRETEETLLLFLPEIPEEIEEDLVSTSTEDLI
jgi:hypothetical protein